ncbi:MAG: 30S ribosomal protein S9 [Bacteroidales bacterium]|jgi:small subunit ribosomal protein S9|nr:30S ribosomal protein S9 [Bacteroidales bacterium]MDI9574962.1 30S ribosomal protein S9 [Bacteroidota bacterium]MDD3755901.1 30S ribosomal protein S9 [Bacteroidales bacterium]MDY0401696.1 30S ribosomal protein S9 [Bacteroidales bacterium]HHW59941.1 30S ribosomal protein S9 [Bacteroidales bacterium]
MDNKMISGRRKEAIARIRLLKVEDGKQEITINNRDYKEYFPSISLHYIVEQPFKLTETWGQYSVKGRLNGGGKKGQAEALRLAISKALVEENPEFRQILKKYKLLTRDPRMVERKKPGQPKARKKNQFSKR